MCQNRMAASASVDSRITAGWMCSSTFVCVRLGVAHGMDGWMDG